MQKLKKPYTSKQKSDFIVKHNHNQGLRIEETETALYALEPWEKLEGDEVLDDKEEWEKEQEQKERERINLLSLTKREVFLALYKAKQITPEMIKAQITEAEALIEFEYANEYYRGNPLIDLIGKKLGYSSDDLDYLFENKELPKQPIDDVAKALIEEGLYPPEMAIELSIPKPITQSPPPSFENKQLSEKSLDDIIEATEEAELYTLPDVSLVDTSDSAEDLTPSAVNIKKDLEKE